MPAYVYILRCRDGSYYVGTTRASLETRIAEHNSGRFAGYTAIRRPVTLAFHQEFGRIEDAVAMERRIKGWRREKKEALIRREFDVLPVLAARGRRVATHDVPNHASKAHPSRRGPSDRSSG